MGVYSEGYASGQNHGSIQVMTSNGANPWGLTLNPRGGSIYIGSTISDCRIFSNILQTNDIISDRNIRASATTTNARTGLIAVSADVSTIVGAYSEGTFVGSNVGSIQVMTSNGLLPY
jgi:hypothetical protein